MSTAERPALAPLIAGQRLDQATFHEQYEAMPPGVRAELVGGVVVMPSPVGDRHGDLSFLAVTWLGHYRYKTPGVVGNIDTSTALDDSAEVQPDVQLRIRPDRGGQTRKLGNIIGGAPELVVEVANSSRANDLGPKLADYERAGTLEYIVFAIDPDEVFWHERREGRLVRTEPDADGLFRSKIFPGLWLDPVAFLADDGPSIVATLERGIGTPQHAAFVARLAADRA